jgi:hypothetical protein
MQHWAIDTAVEDRRRLSRKCREHRGMSTETSQEAVSKKNSSKQEWE